jgi:hypothetical protein
MKPDRNSVVVPDALPSIAGCTDPEAYSLILQFALCAAIRDAVPFAKRLVGIALLIRPNDPMALHADALVKHQGGATDEAIQTLETMLIDYPDNMMGHALLAGLYGITNDPRSAFLLAKIEKLSTDQTASALAKSLKRAISNAANPLSRKQAAPKSPPVVKFQKYL